MKTLTLSITCALAVAGAAYGQGNINWTLSPAAITAQTNSAQLSPFGFYGITGPIGINGGIGGTLGVGNFYFELLYTAYTGVQAPVPNSLADLESWYDAGAEARSTAAAGYLAAYPSANAGFTVPWSPGTTDSIVLVGWSANLGTTWSAAEAALNNWDPWSIPNGFFGVSQTGYITTLATTTVPGSVVFARAATAQGLPINSRNMQLYALPLDAPTPEPGTMALAGLGGLALWLMRRRKQAPS